ncbi:DUF6338 family protein [Paludisphaera borealis]|uniref:Uncharacterized protein n=1 Tax=Paludisphaera borealis TaxID=1387353 RepID=A0A1U7CZC4_9BACT|nr:DUF6338 family protein [Paludisphaera borealis]APW64307.1 hypothetical protein BSF38_20025 [Paludisphaera borealis]
MSLISKDVTTLVFTLLPGFIAAAIFYMLTAHPKTSEFERVVQSLIFTALVKFVVLCLGWTFIRIGSYKSIGAWNSNSEFQWSIIIAIAIGFTCSYIANTDKFHGFIRRMDISKRTSYPSEWFGTFAEQKRYIVLHLDGKRRLRGWPKEWPDQPDKGHFVILNPEWILNDNQVASLPEVASLMIPANEVKMVEFLKINDELPAADDQDAMRTIDQSMQLLLGAQIKEGKKEDVSGSKAT